MPVLRQVFLREATLSHIGDEACHGYRIHHPPHDTVFLRRILWLPRRWL